MNWTDEVNCHEFGEAVNGQGSVSQFRGWRVSQRRRRVQFLSVKL